MIWSLSRLLYLDLLSCRIISGDRLLWFWFFRRLISSFTFTFVFVFVFVYMAGMDANLEFLSDTISDCISSWIRLFLFLRMHPSLDLALLRSGCLLTIDSRNSLFLNVSDFPKVFENGMVGSDWYDSSDGDKIVPTSGCVQSFLSNWRSGLFPLCCCVSSLLIFNIRLPFFFVFSGGLLLMVALAVTSCKLRIVIRDIAILWLTGTPVR